jgi:hypothetical protein
MASLVLPNRGQIRHLAPGRSILFSYSELYLPLGSRYKDLNFSGMPHARTIDGYQCYRPLQEKKYSNQ